MLPQLTRIAWLLLAVQGGYTSEKFPELGLSFPRARTYEAIPTQPNEEQIVLSFAEKIPDDPKKRRPARPTLDIVWIERAPQRAARTGAGEVPPAGGETPAEKPKEKSAPKPKPVIDSIARFVELRLPEWKLGEPKPGKDREGCKVREYTLEGKKGAPPQLWICSYENELRTIALVGMCDSKDLAEQEKIWRYTAEHLDIGVPEAKDKSKLEQFYAKHPLKGIEHRVQVRLDMVRGWKVEDTENFIVLYDTPDQPLVRKIVRDVEYEHLFPAEKPVDSVSTVRICKSRDEYLSYGAPPQSAGYWNWNDEELVLYDAQVQDRSHHISDANTFIALYHEAFHQYIHYSTGELPPHSWFNEGHGDFFSGATVKDGKVRAIGPNPWRVNYIQEAIEADKYVPLKELMAFEQPDYYRPDRIGLCYAEGWSLIYFLRKSELVAKRPEWAQILPTYFAELKSGYAAELAKLEAQGKAKDQGLRARAGLEVRKAALAKATEGVDIDELEKAWKAYVLTIPEPKKE